MWRTLVVTLAVVLSVAALGCPASEDDPELCAGGTCGPGVCLQYCKTDAGKDGASTDASAADAAEAGDGGDADAAETSTISDASDGG